MRVDRLQHLITVLENVPREQFDLHDWIRQEENSPDDLDKRKKPFCGMVACAGGWATFDPKFMKAGLKRDEDGWPAYKGQMGFAALQKFFDISEEDCVWMFSELEYNTQNPGKHHVVRRIKALIRRHAHGVTT